jgi:hypothetical protein
MSFGSDDRARGTITASLLEGGLVRVAREACSAPVRRILPCE